MARVKAWHAGRASKSHLYAIVRGLRTLNIGRGDVHKLEHATAGAGGALRARATHPCGRDQDSERTRRRSDSSMVSVHSPGRLLLAVPMIWALRYLVCTPETAHISRLATPDAPGRGVVAPHQAKGY
jgi:hypothetical protein